MNFEEVVACLETTGKREEFILRLKNAGENSTPFLHVQSAMVELKMNILKAPRGIDEKTILQHTFQFTNPKECFTSFRLVCKSWKDAVETIKFNREVPAGGLFMRYILRSIIPGSPLSPFFGKYLQCFRKLYAPMDCFSSENGHHMISLVLNNTQKLNHIHFDNDSESLPETVDPFMLQMLGNSHETLQYISISRFCIPDISFPKLKILEMEIGIDICLQEFKTYFPQVLKNMERLETVDLQLVEAGSRCVCEYIGNNYGKHCIRGSYNLNILNFVPAKILIHVDDISDLSITKYVSELQYLQLFIHHPEEPMSCGWDKYQDIFDQCLNLKAIELNLYTKVGFDWLNSKFTISQVSAANQSIWQERMAYFKARGIRIVDKDEIFENENLETKLAKEAGVTWKFCFDCFFD